MAARCLSAMAEVCVAAPEPTCDAATLIEAESIAPHAGQPLAHTRQAEVARCLARRLKELPQAAPQLLGTISASWSMGELRVKVPPEYSHRAVRAHVPCIMT
jgi:hypothetical protein